MHLRLDLLLGGELRIDVALGCDLDVGAGVRVCRRCREVWARRPHGDLGDIGGTDLGRRDRRCGRVEHLGDCRLHRGAPDELDVCGDVRR